MRLIFVKLGDDIGWYWSSGYHAGWGNQGENSQKSGHFLRDGIASGRGVHRKMGVWIQKSRSNFGVKSEKSPKIEILGVGVV